MVTPTSFMSCSFSAYNAWDTRLGGFTYDGKENLRAHHLYVCPRGSDELRRHLAFRDHLRSSPAAVREYGRIKEEAARLHPHDKGGYAEHKAPFFEKVYAELGL